MLIKKIAYDACYENDDCHIHLQSMLMPSTLFYLDMEILLLKLIKLVSLKNVSIIQVDCLNGKKNISADKSQNISQHIFPFRSPKG